MVVFWPMVKVIMVYRLQTEEGWWAYYVLLRQELVFVVIFHFHVVLFLATGSINLEVLRCLPLVAWVGYSLHVVLTVKLHVVCVVEFLIDCLVVVFRLVSLLLMILLVGWIVEFVMGRYPLC